MTASARSHYSLAWRLALTAVLVRVAYAALVQGYTLVGLPESAQLREAFIQPQYLVPFLANIAASSIFVGLTVWSASHRWLRQHNTLAVDAPGKLFGLVIVLTLVFSLAVSALMIYLQSVLVLYAVQHAGAANKFLTMGLILGAVAVALEVLGAYLAVRIATRTVQPAGHAGGPAYKQRHASWSAGSMILGWQLSVCIAMGSYLNAQSLTVGWLQYALGFLILPVLLLVLCTYVCLKILPRPIGAARQGRAVALGTLAFWLAQVLGVGLGFLAIRAMTWDQLIRAADSNVVAVVMLVVYAALLVLGCWVGKLALYGASRRLVPAG
ncbi:hypothetical protein [Achromobacter sp.]|uniref:hypothetical protein n=1 Tax=Achromobacter sp. TaxID=134375 RepID=UPI0028999F45|nr:hypothetical protein [Achromobacter sp.]